MIDPMAIDPLFYIILALLGAPAIGWGGYKFLRKNGNNSNNESSIPVNELFAQSVESQKTSATALATIAVHMELNGSKFDLLIEDMNNRRQEKEIEEGVKRELANLRT